MLFPTFTFFCFFVVVFGVYWSLRSQLRRLQWLLLASIYFYMSWNPYLIGLILFSASTDFMAGLFLERCQTAWKRKLLLIGSIACNLSLLLFFKYVNFFLDSVYVAQTWLGSAPNRFALDVVLPLGISFYTFETITYIVDVYQRRITAVRNPLEYAVFILFFPHLVAGPIVRPRDFVPQTRRFRRFNWDRFQLGLQFLLIGLLKKAALADQIALIIDPIFDQPGQNGTLMTWFAALGYAAQIYLDFSGYSDMAIGLAHLLGYHLPNNFNLPYLAVNVSDFWRRWHTSLSSWLRDYVFIPLGGSRGSRWQTSRNLMIVMLLGGLWHGASWTYMAWGLYHGLLLLAHRFAAPYLPDHPALKPFKIALTFVSFCVGLVFVRAPNVGAAWAMIERMFVPCTAGIVAIADARHIVALLAVVAIGFLAASFVNFRQLERRLPAGVMGGALAALFYIALFLVPDHGKAFIYFQF
jgi:alginate O-acetyltransferase complex protein AlgI